MNANRLHQLAALGTVTLCAASLAQSIVAIPPGTGYNNSAITYIASNGVLIGYSTNAAQGVSIARPSRWASPEAAAELLGVDPAGGGGLPHRASSDGSVIVGQWNGAGINTPAMWNAAGAYTALSGPGSVSIANGVSADGTITTGNSDNGGRWLLRWTGGVLTQQFGGISGTQFLPGPCSPDGTTALGIRNGAVLSRWTLAGGPNGTLQDLITFPATWTNIRFVIDMTPTASAALGLAYTTTNGYRGWMWRNGQLTDMGLPAPLTSLEPTRLNADATLAVGNGFYPSPPFTLSRGYVWTQSAGWLYLADWLSTRGISFPGWSYSLLYYISPDGRTLAGQGTSPTGEVRGFIITLPAPCYANCDQSTSPPLLTTNDFQCFLNKFASADSAANCDGSTNIPILTANDFQCFINAFAGGCPS